MITTFTLSVARRFDYREEVITPRDLKALAAFLSAFADAPESVNVRIGAFQLDVTITGTDTHG